MESYLLALKPSTGDVPSVEIGESKIIGNANKVYYMFGIFGIIDRSNKNCSVFCMMDNCSKESPLPIKKNNVDTINDIKENNYNSAEEKHTINIFLHVFIQTVGGMSIFGF